MKVVVTGGCGFIGAHVVEKLESAGHVAVVLDRAHPKAPLELSLLRPDDLQGADAVIHCAAHADVRSNWEPGQTRSLWLDNMAATYRLLEMCAVTPTIRSFVFVSTGAVYAEQMSPYAASKIGGEAFCKAYAAKWKWNLAIVRPAACFGLGYHHGHVADFVEQAKVEGRIKALTRGAPRPALHVLDCADFLTDCAIIGTSGTFHMRAHEPWGCRETAQLVSVPAEWADGDSGWIGDLHEDPDVPDVTVYGKRSVMAGVQDAIRSCGWPT